MTDFLSWWADHWPLIPVIILFAPRIYWDWKAVIENRRAHKQVKIERARRSLVPEHGR